jgi:hypothetical protein
MVRFDVKSAWQGISDLMMAKFSLSSLLQTARSCSNKTVTVIPIPFLTTSHRKALQSYKAGSVAHTSHAQPQAGLLIYSG